MVLIPGNAAALSVPIAPGLPTFVSGTSTALTLSYNTFVPSATSFDARYRLNVPESSWTEIPDVASPFTISDLTSNSSFLVQVRARNSFGIGAYSTARQAQTAPGASDIPTSALFWWFDAANAESDDLGTPCVDLDPVRTWRNIGSQEDAEQSTLARRPIFRTGGRNGHPYLEGLFAEQRHFEDLAYTQPAGISGSDAIRAYTIIVVIEDPSSLANSPSLFGNSVQAQGKVSLHLRSVVGQQINHVDRRAGNITKPSVISALVRASTAATPTPIRQLWQNGVSLGDVVGNWAPGANAAIASMQFLRHTALVGEGYFEGKIYEALFWDRDLSTAERQLVEAYAKSKYNGI